MTEPFSDRMRHVCLRCLEQETPSCPETDSPENGPLPFTGQGYPFPPFLQAVRTHHRACLLPFRDRSTRAPPTGDGRPTFPPPEPCSRQPLPCGSCGGKPVPSLRILSRSCFSSRTKKSTPADTCACIARLPFHDFHLLSPGRGPACRSAPFPAKQRKIPLFCRIRFSALYGEKIFNRKKRDIPAFSLLSTVLPGTQRKRLKLRLPREEYDKASRPQARRAWGRPAAPPRNPSGKTPCRGWAERYEPGGAPSRVRD